MSYATQADLEKRIPVRELIQLTDDEKLGVVNAARITEALEIASSTIDSYAGTKYAIPLQTSVKVRDLCVDLAAWCLEKRRARIRKDTQKAYEAAIGFLKDLSASRATLDQPTGASPQTGAGELKATEEEQVFSDDHLRGY
jgi:phage gp36-like protein